MSWFDRLRSQATVNYNEDSEESEEDLEEGLNFDSPLASPSRPVQSREGSPQELAHPTLNDNVDEELAQVSQTLLNIGHTPLFRGQNIGHTQRLRGVPEGEEAGAVNLEVDEVVEEEEVIEGLIAQPAEDLKVDADNSEEVVGEGENGEHAEVNIMAVFEDVNEADDDKALSSALRIIQGFEWKPNDINFYFNQLEIKMTTAGVKKNWTKFQVLTTVLPSAVQDEVKSILQKGETDFPNNDAYKILKHKVLKIFGQSEESRFERAMQRTLTGKPSQLARVLVNDICDHELEGCCCKRAVAHLWKRALPIPVRQAIAHIEFNKVNFDNIVGVADSVFQSGRPSGVSIAALQQPASSSSAQVPQFQTPHNPTPLDTAFTVPNPDDPVQAAAQSIVAAVQNFGFRGRGRSSGGRGGQSNRGGNSSGRGGRSNRGGQSNRGGGGQGGHRWSNLKKHADNPPSSVCKKHYLHGKSAHWCEEPGTCPWKDFWVPKGQQ